MNVYLCIMKAKEEFEDRYDKFVEKFNKWWYRIWRSASIISFLCLLAFCFLEWDDALVKSVFIFGISFFMCFSSPLDPPSNIFGGWF